MYVAYIYKKKKKKSSFENLFSFSLKNQFNEGTLYPHLMLSFVGEKGEGTIPFSLLEKENKITEISET